MTVSARKGGLPRGREADKGTHALLDEGDTLSRAAPPASFAPPACVRESVRPLRPSPSGRDILSADVAGRVLVWMRGWGVGGCRLQGARTVRAAHTL